ncbi:tyrosine-type recombinase/integrase [Candidatus Tisiphia endosymbiont of Ceraclea dissimilis]|uniref:tyrosine-type recombinase/integrase n=1 Tax=Candidatus Tisiphia endosymbiont of Ceraclea dissimilis TaxID=3077928 RepID=UPI003CCA81C8
MNHLIVEFKNYLIKQEMSINTIRNYLADIVNFSKWYKIYYSDQVIADEITSYHLQSFKSHSVNTKRLKTSSINRRIQSLKRFFQFLSNKKTIKKDPTLKTKFIRRTKSAKPNALNKSEVHALLSIAGRSSHGTHKRNYAIIQLILQTGLRVSEVINLQWQDIVLGERSGQVRVVDGKGHKERIIPLNSSARKAVSSYLEFREDLKETSPIFLSKRNQVPTARAIQKIIVSLANKANINRIKVTPHTLRHTFATNYLRTNPGCLVELSNLLGHESLDTTAIYTKSSQEHLAGTLEKSQFIHDGL